MEEKEKLIIAESELDSIFNELEVNQFDQEDDPELPERAGVKITRDQVNSAVEDFLKQGGSVRRFWSNNDECK